MCRNLHVKILKLTCSCVDVNKILTLSKCTEKLQPLSGFHCTNYSESLINRTRSQKMPLTCFDSIITLVIYKQRSEEETAKLHLHR